MPLTLTKPLGLGVMNNRHKATGERFENAIITMTTLNDKASAAALAAGATAATDITGFGLLGHLHKLARASGCAAVIDAASVPYLEGARTFADEGFIPGGSKRNLDWVRPHLSAHGIGDIELLLLADAQTSGGLLVGAELSGHPIIGELVDGPAGQITIR
jgi:selenide,water dikinase